MRTIVEIKGGLGNQLFQLAFAKWLAKLPDLDSFVDLSFFERRVNGDSERSLAAEPERFGLQVEHSRIRAALDRTFAKHIRVPADADFSEFIPTGNRKHFFYSGYFQDYALAEEMRQFLSTLIQTMIGPFEKRRNTVMVHCRLGDYLENPVTQKYHGVTHPAWSIRQARELNSALELDGIEVFSDNEAFLWREFGDDLQDFEIISSTDPWETLRLMLSCRAFVLSNSTFSWWAAVASEWFYGDDPYVICPTPWFGTFVPSETRLHLPSWTIREREIYATTGQ